VGDDAGERLGVVGRGPLVAGHDHGAGAVVDARAVAGGVGAVRVERRQLGQDLEAGLAPRRLVDLDHVLALLGLDRDRHDLLGQAAVVGGVDRALVRAQRPAILVLTRDAELAGHERRLLDHVPVVEGRREPVVDGQVDQRPVAEPVAEARLLQCVRRVAHRLHPPGDDDVVLARADHQVGDLDRADAGGADLVDRVRRELDRQACGDGRLA
jgi:hypothetical protein